MSISADSPETIVDLLLEALSDNDGPRAACLFAPSGMVQTVKTSYQGPAEIEAWAEKGYDHLVRRLQSDELTHLGEGEYLSRGRLEFLWRESREVADSAPQWFVFRLGEAGIEFFSLADDEESARALL